MPRVHAVELDQVLVHYLQEKFRNEPKFSVQHGDILKANLSEWGPVQVAGNLPYYITSPIIERVLALGPNLLHAVFLVQKEVAMRIAAQPGSRDYGYLSVQVQVYAEPKLSVYRPTIAPSARRRRSIRLLSSSIRGATPITADPAGIGPVCRYSASGKSVRCCGIISPDHSQSEAIDAQPEARLRAEQLSVAQLADFRDRILKFQ